MQIIKKILYFVCTIALIAIISVFLYLYFPSRQTPIPFDYGGWDNGSVRHILPQFDHRQLVLKVSFEESLGAAPQLLINDNVVQGISKSPDRKFWTFYSNRLNPSTEYKLQIKDATGEELSDSWNITTHPDPSSSPESMRMLKYTCAGGISETVFGQEVFLDMNYRRALLERALKETPRIVIANGDHVYWDQETSEKSFLQRLLKLRRDRMYGSLDLTESMTSPNNYEIFKNVMDDQIVELYGCLLREKSVYFITDDHDLLENDDAIEDKGIVSFPPKEYMEDAEFYTQQLYYPGFLATDRLGDKVIRFANFGEMQYGDLVGMNMFDAKQFVSLEADSATMIPSGVEKGLIESTLDSSVIWNFQATSSPFAWTAGKWLEWYPDILDGDHLTIEKEKYLWQEGWWNQHQRLLTAFHERKNPSIILQGDLHMASYGMIQKSGDLDFSSNPIPVITTAPLGSGKLGFPSSFRGVGATVPINMEVDEIYKPVERNGFTILNLDRNQVAFDIYTWRLPETMEDIRNLKPSFSSSINRK